NWIVHTILPDSRTIASPRRKTERLAVSRCKLRSSNAEISWHAVCDSQSYPQSASAGHTAPGALTAEGATFPIELNHVRGAHGQHARLMFRMKDVSLVQLRTSVMSVRGIIAAAVSS
ncbi:MAG TPA: hypothetical protein VKB76_14310, partial [Ktedonobacterales bacterium]|nr:hypothetical protein [Ktedonobacterales bacterium]